MPGTEPSALKGLASTGWPAGSVELLVAEGENPSRQRNHAANMATGDILYFLDDDSVVIPSAFEILSNDFADDRWAAVGGPSLTPSSDSILQRSIGAALASVFGSGAVRNRYRAYGAVRESGERELILCNLAVRRDRFLACGGFDERLYPNEENEFLDRLSANGGKIMHDPRLFVERSQRKTLFEFIRQMFRYGRGRSRQSRIAGFSGIMPFIPLFFVIYLLSVPFVLAPFWKLPLFAYSVLSLVSGTAAALPYRSMIIAMILPSIFLLMHIANGVGLLTGFILPMPNEACYKEPVIRRLSLEQT